MPEGSTREVDASVPQHRNGMSRRAFLKVAAATVVVLSGAIPDVQIPKPSKNLDNEKELTEFSPQVTVIDAASSFDNNSLIQKLLGEDYISENQLKQEFGDAYKEHWDKVFEKYPKQAAVYRFTEISLSHGELVTQVMEKIWNAMGLKNTGIRFEPLQLVIDPTNLGYEEDALSNPSITVQFDQKRMIQLLKNNPHRVINASFELGGGTYKTVYRQNIVPLPEPVNEGGLSDSEGNIYLGAVGISVNKDGSIVYVDGNGQPVPPTSEAEINALKAKKQKEAEQKATVETIDNPASLITGAYDSSRAEQNVPKVFEVCNAFPDKLFVFAAGNQGEDLRKPLEKVGDNRPANLIIVGDWIKGDNVEYPYGGVLGANIYIDNTSIGLPDGSTFSTAATSAIAEVLFKKGLSKEEVIEKIRSVCQRKEFFIDNNPTEMLVFDADSLQKLKV